MSKRIVILGAGESGTGAAILAQKEGYEVFVSDLGKIMQKYKDRLHEYDIEYEEGKHTINKIHKADEVIKSPGIPNDTTLIKILQKTNIRVISEIEFAARFTNAKLICITGSNGKTTTTLLTYHILKKAGLNVGLAGNIGQSFAFQVAQKNCDYYVLEISSFQLDGMFDFKADISVLLNITPDHLDRYDKKFQKYVDAKFRITQNQTENEFFIYWHDDEIIRKGIEEKMTEGRNVRTLPFGFDKYEEGAYLKRGNIVVRYNNETHNVPSNELALKGMHNSLNSMASSLVAKVLNISWNTISEGLRDFENVEHRLEYVSTLHEIDFINDSKATNISSTWYALDSIQQPVIWIAGGIDKGNDYSLLNELVQAKVKAIVCLGKDNSKIRRAFRGKIEIVETDTMKMAIEAAYILAERGDCILLSPACASFDLFRSYEDRGRSFKTEVQLLHEREHKTY